MHMAIGDYLRIYLPVCLSQCVRGRARALLPRPRRSGIGMADKQSMAGGGLEGGGQRERCEEIAVGVRELAAQPVMDGPHLPQPLLVRRVHVGNGPNGLQGAQLLSPCGVEIEAPFIGVAAQQAHIALDEQVEHVRRPRTAPQLIARRDERVDRPLARNRRENRAQATDIAVNVREDGDAHLVPPILPWPAPASHPAP